MSSKKLESRRNFLKDTTVVAAGTTLAASLNLGLVRSVHAQGDDVIKIALIGCGGRGTGAADQLPGGGESTRTTSEVGGGGRCI